MSEKCDTSRVVALEEAIFFLATGLDLDDPRHGFDNQMKKLVKEIQHKIQKKAIDDQKQNMIAEDKAVQVAAFMARYRVRRGRLPILETIAQEFNRSIAWASMYRRLAIARGYIDIPKVKAR